LADFDRDDQCLPLNARATPTELDQGFLDLQMEGHLRPKSFMDELAMTWNKISFQHRQFQLSTTPSSHIFE